ncbi:glucosyltransferase domain-containing protein [Sodalis ligni]|uniref:Glucosyltransferase GtrII-like protein n=1 Tax=Sodalis ligni TaxID=2697027 RepID=A0A4R1NMT7_9GAMM|nr:glucosyltransferase domain-containing protein [Sodalis ligni]TCL07361.1 glucosyltransferase GtrII-like protein [Sodalis ligni]
MKHDFFKTPVFYSFVSALLSCLIVYVFELTHFTLSIDEEFQDNFFQTIMLGRWGDALIKANLLSGPYSPGFTALFGLITLSCAFASTASILKLSRFQGVIFSILAVSVPQYAYQLEFMNQADTVGTAFLLSAITVYFVTNTSLCGRYIYACMTYTIAISIYQSLATLPVTIVMGFVISSTLREESNIKESLILMIKFAVLSLCAFSMYTIISLFFSKYYNISGVGYLSSSINWGKMPLHAVFNQMKKFIVPYFTFRTFYGLNSYPFVILAFILMLWRAQYKFFMVFMGICLIVSPFIFMFVSGGFQPPRVVTSLSFSFAIIFILALRNFKSRWISTITAMAFLIAGATSSNKLFYSDYIAEQHDLMLSNRMISDIYRNFPDFSTTKNDVYFYGKSAFTNPWKMPNSDSFGESHYTWDGGNNRRIIAFMRITGLIDLTEARKEDIDRLQDTAAGMPLWPNEGGIKKVNDIIIIKLGENRGIE